MLRVTKLEFERAVRPALARAMRRQTSPSNTSAHQALSASSQEKVEAEVTAPLTNDKAFSTILSPYIFAADIPTANSHNHSFFTHNRYIIMLFCLYSVLALPRKRPLSSA